jgi:hypothetical protein
VVGRVTGKNSLEPKSDEHRVKLGKWFDCILTLHVVAILQQDEISSNVMRCLRWISISMPRRMMEIDGH